MARQHGIAGRTLKIRLWILAGTVIAIGVIVTLVLRNVHPLLTPFAPVAGLFVVTKMLQDRKLSKELVAKGRGAIGEDRVGRALAKLPTGWRLFHDVQLDGENADHVVVGNRGVFSIEVKNYSGTIKVEPRGVVTRGKRNDAIVRQAHRQSHKLRELLGVEVQPVLVFVGVDLPPTRSGKLPVMDESHLVEHLLGQTERWLDLEEGRRVMGVLEGRVAGARA